MAAFSLAVYFLLFHVTGVFGSQYTVTVITDPPSGPFLAGNPINFTCHVSPLPSEPITYSWHAMTNANGPTTLSGQNTTHYTPSYRDLHFSWFFCKVFSNESLISVGRRLLEIHGFVFSVEPLFHTFTLSSTIELQVNISNDYSATRYIRTLVWYHNGTEIQASGRVSVLNNGTRITIRDTTHTDAGYYRVEIASLDFNDPVCDSLWFPLLRNHAAHAPVTFTIRLRNESLPSKCCTDEHPYTRNIPQQYYPLVNSDSSTLFTFSHNTDLSSSWTMSTTTSAISYLSSSLSVNGSSLASDASKFNLSQTALGSGVLTQVIDFQYYFSDEGFYVHSLYFSDPYYLFYVGDEGRLRRYRCLNYYDYAEKKIYLRLRQISFIIFPFILTTYKPPTQINISSVYFAESGLTQLVCTATGGVPDLHNITLFHSNQDQQLLATNMGNELQSYVDLYNLYLGGFICTVESLYGTKQVSLLLYEKGSFQLLLAVNNRMMCIQVTKVNRSAICEDIRNFFKIICDCAVDLEQVSVDCFTTGNVLLSGTVIYSNSEVNSTASTLIDMLQVWLLTTTDPTIILQHQPFKLISQCPARLTSATVDVCRNLSQKPEVNISAAIGGSFIGGVLTGILACSITLCIGLCVLRLKADMSMRKAGSTSEASPTVKEDDVLMDTNQAYETVEMRYRYQSAAASASQPPAGLQEQSTIEEPVYENH